MFAFVADLRHGIRLLMRAPVFTLIATVALAVGVGANVTIFSFASELLLRPMEVPEADRLVRAFERERSADALVPFDDYLQYRDRNQTLSDMAAFHWGGIRRIRVDGTVEETAVTLVTGNYFHTLGVRAAIGRLVSPEDERPGSYAVVVLSDLYWRRRFGADPRVIGRTIFIDNTPTTIIGVTPASFKGTISPIIPQLYTPYADPRHGLLIGRLRKGVSRNKPRPTCRGSPHNLVRSRIDTFRSSYRLPGGSRRPS